jgi:hypothetical protein
MAAYVPPDWDSFPGRLRWAIDEHQRPKGRQRGLRLFQRKMEREEGVAGTSLSAIQSYLRGKAEPTRPFIMAAAKVLRIRASWLAFGEGQPTEAVEMAFRTAMHGGDPDRDPAPEEGFRKSIPWDYIGAPAKAQIWELYHRVGAHVDIALDPDLPSPEAFRKRNREEAEIAARAVAAAAVELGLPFRRGVPGIMAQDTYIVCVCEGLFALLREALSERFSNGEA